MINLQSAYIVLGRVQENDQNMDMTDVEAFTSHVLKSIPLNQVKVNNVH